MDNKFVKLSELVGQTFTVTSVGEHKFKMWDNAAKQMLVSDDWQKGYKKVYAVDTDKGRLDIGQGQMGTMLEAASYRGKADLTNVTFELKSNGKTGMEIRYFFNVKKQDVVDVTGDEPIDLDNVPDFGF